MNELNYASLEASKKLYEAGIVLETDMNWVKCKDGMWVFMRIGEVGNHAVSEIETWIPAPCFTDVWRELPAGASVYKGTVVEVANTAACMVDRIKTPYIERTNPTDALIDLLVWLKGQFERRNP